MSGALPVTVLLSLLSAVAFFTCPPSRPDRPDF